MIGRPSPQLAARQRRDQTSTAQIFTDIYRRNAWGGTESVSGQGSDRHQTTRIIDALPALLRDCNARTMLDIPCGDFHWMSQVDVSQTDYTGADIVAEMIQRNRERYETSRVRFQTLNLITDPLPQVGLIFCRDCLVHLSFADIATALHNICASHSEYLLTTTFTGPRHNGDIATGRWRVLNLQRAPFLLPPPLRILREGCTEGDGMYGDKALGLWRIADLRAHLARRP